MKLKPINIILLLALLASSASAQNNWSYYGTDFWMAFLPNWYETDNDVYSFCVAAERPCTVTITNPASGWSHVMNVQGGQATTYQVPQAQSPNLYQTASCTITHKGIHVTSTDTIMLFAMNNSGTPQSSDATSVMPTASLASNYIVQTYPVNNNVSQYHSCFSVVATEDNTLVDIVFSDATLGGFVAGDAITVTMNAGDVYQVKSPLYRGDFSGTRVTARDCKRVAVFSGATLARVPNGSTISGDHIFQQNLPTQVWGQSWVLIPQLSSETRIYYRLTAGEDTCRISCNGSYHSTVLPYHTVDMSPTVGMTVQSSAPAAVFGYTQSRNNSSPGCHGDVSGFPVPPFEQAVDRVIFPTFSVSSRSPYTTSYYISAVVPAGETALLRLDGNPVTGFQTIGGQYAYAICPISVGYHLLTTQGSGFVANAYGMAENYEAYGFNLGCRTLAIAPPHHDTVDTSVCFLPIVFRGQTINDAGPHLLGDSCSGTTLLNITLNPSYNIRIDTATCDSLLPWGDTILTAGVHSFRDWTVHGCDSITLITLRRWPSYTDVIDTVFCGDTLFLSDTVITTSGTYSRRHTTLHGCDSSITMNLSIRPEYFFTIDTALCLDSLLWEDTVFRHLGEHQYHYTTVHGCDSVANIVLRLLPSYDTLYRVVISDTESYTWIDGNTYTASIDTTLRYVNRYGCDSLLRLSLTVERVPSRTSLWVPNVFTPGRPDNSLFRVYGKNLADYEIFIFQRWGMLVFHSADPEEPWDGTYKGIPCHQGTYVYIIHFREESSPKEKQSMVGTVTLLR